MANHPTLAPELDVSAWLNTATPLSLQALRGKVVVIHAFQMLCPGCVSHGIPQTKKIRETFREEDVAVIGLHSVFEHHDVMTPRALEVFLHEYRIAFPIAIDRPTGHGGVPRTMARYQLRGTPSLLLIDRHGYLRFHHFGHVDDLRVGAQIAQLMAEGAAIAAAPAPAAARAGCDDQACGIAATP